MDGYIDDIEIFFTISGTTLNIGDLGGKRVIKSRSLY
jgi:hypothetical protein